MVRVVLVFRRAPLSTSLSSTSRTVLPGARPVRLETRKICVSTAMVGSPKAVLSTTFAVLRPTPGNASSASRVRGTSPPCCSSSCRHMAMTFAALALYRPMMRDVALESVLAEREDRRRRIGDGEQPARGLVDADVGRLRGQDHRDQQFEWRGVDQFGRRLRVELRKPGEQFADFVRSQVRAAAPRLRLSLLHVICTRPAARALCSARNAAAAAAGNGGAMRQSGDRGSALRRDTRCATRSCCRRASRASRARKRSRAASAARRASRAVANSDCVHAGEHLAQPCNRQQPGVDRGVEVVRCKRVHDAMASVARADRSQPQRHGDPGRQRPVNAGLRRSRNAAVPSRMSSVAKISPNCALSNASPSSIAAFAAGVDAIEDAAQRERRGTGELRGELHRFALRVPPPVPRD